VKFFEEGAAPNETMLSTISSISKGGIKNALQARKDDACRQQLKKETTKQGTPLLMKKLLNQLLLQQDQCHQS